MAQRSIRFGIHDGKNHRASTWKLWTEPSSKANKSDVYLACRSLGGSLKVSLHETGQWHIAYSQQAFEDKVKGSIPMFNDRYIRKWPRPSEVASGTTLAFRIVTPWSAITNTKERGNFKKITWLPKAQKPNATEIDIIITKSTIPVTGWPCKRSMGTSLIGSIPLANGDIVWAVYRLVKMPDLSSINNRSGHFYRGKSKKDLQEEGLRALVFGKEPDGSRVIYDCAVEVNNPVKKLGISMLIVGLGGLVCILTYLTF